MALRTSLVAQPHLYMGDTQGRPLDAGKVYFGEPNKDPELYPINVFYDEALTIAAPQPIRTMGGFMNANGQMVEVYAAETTYSVKVLDGYGRQVFYQESMTSENAELQAVKFDTGITATAKFGGVERTQAEKNSDSISIDDFGSIDDIEISLSGKRIDLLGRTITVTAIPSNNTYFNGFFEIDGVSYTSNRVQDIKVTNNAVIIGSNTGSKELTSGSAVVAIGNGAMQSMGSARSNIAIGTRSLNSMVAGKYNIAIGLESQFHCNSDDGGSSAGTRNVSVGDNSLRFNETGEGNLVMGRNAGQCIVSSRNVALGTNAMSASGSLKFKNLSDIYLQTPITTVDTVVVGHNSAYRGAASNCVAVGTNTLASATKNSISNVAVGYDALSKMGINDGAMGGVITSYDITGSYVMTETSVSLTFSGVSVKAGDYIVVRFQDGIPIYETTSYRDPQTYLVKSVVGSTITVDEPEGIVANGSVKLASVEDLTLTPKATKNNIAIGRGAMWASPTGERNVMVGDNAGRVATGIANIGIGYSALFNHEQSSGTNNIAIGQSALRLMQDGSNNTSSNNSVGIGQNTAVSGDNQVQIGSSSQTVYAYGAVQDRSDARDKIIEGGITDAHIDFFNDVEFKRYRLDYRDDYIVSNDDGTVTKLDKDGSKARKREHVGVIAQQVEEAMKAHNVDFAGLQHHAVNDGNDVYTVGYQEFIPILGEIVQRQQKQIDELKELIKK